MSKKVWVQVTEKLDGVYPGDWIEIDRQKARMWLTEGKCIILKNNIRQGVLDLTNCAVILKGTNVNRARKALERQYPGMDITSEFTSPRTLFWDTSLDLDLDLIPIGFGLLLKGWQVAIPLVDYDLLARDIGSEQDRARTKKVLHDLRVPVYDTRLIFAKRCKASQELLGVWKEEGHDELAFLRALHQVKPLVNALPPFWIKK